MAKSDDKQFIIPFVGLKQGRHEFSFDITDTFFETFEYSIIQEGEVHVDFTLDKKDTMMVGEFQLDGVVKTPCGRCNDTMDVTIEGSFRLVYKFGTEDEEDESIVIVYPEEFEINIKHSILEFMTVLLPSRTVHEEGECNQEMLDYLEQYMVNSIEDDEDDDFDDEYDDEDFNELEDEGVEDENDADMNDEDVDPRWAALKNLKR
ncbi:MAG: DUF177 domain-containing protein [Flavobacteriales bacterium]|nr:DUF177 domain-containing protein [Flavobacteriales bacterium]